MTDKELIGMLEKIKKYCNKKACGCGCAFGVRDKEDREYYNCQFKELIHELDYNPNNWDIEKIEEIINE